MHNMLFTYFVKDNYLQQYNNTFYLSLNNITHCIKKHNTMFLLTNSFKKN